MVLVLAITSWSVKWGIGGRRGACPSSKIDSQRRGKDYAQGKRKLPQGQEEKENREKGKKKKEKKKQRTKKKKRREEE